MVIKLQDFARECGVTDRAIQKHLKNHEDDLQGHFERKGPNGTWLDEYAQEYIRGLMIQNPPAVVDTTMIRENEELRKELQAVTRELAAAYKENAKLQGAQARLEASEASQRLLEASLEDTRSELVKVRQETQETVRELSESQTREATLQLQLEQEKSLRLAAEEREKALKGRNWWGRLTRKGE